MSSWYDRLSDPLALLIPRVADAHAQVRLETVRALAGLHQPRAAEIALRALDRPVDRYVDYAVWLTVRELEPYWLPAFLRGEIDFDHNSGHMLYALRTSGSPQVVPALVRLLDEGRLKRQQQEEAFQLITQLGGPREMGLVFDRVVGAAANLADTQRSLLDSLEQASRQRGVRPAGDLTRLGQLLDRTNDVAQARAARLVGLWKVQALLPRLVDFVRSSASNDGLRQAAVDGLALLGTSASKKALEALCDARQPLGLRLMAAVGLASLDRHAGIDVL